jgi:hypothetical protein
VWEYRGIRGGGNEPPSCCGKFRGLALVIGSARCAWEDLEPYRTRSKAAVVVNDMGIYLDWPIDHWVSLHPELLTIWLDLRRKHSYPISSGYETHTQKSSPGIKNAWNLEKYAAYSGLFAVEIALLLGYDEIVMCGIPADGSGRFFDPPWLAGHHDDKNGKDSFKRHCLNNKELTKRVRSMSGWTKQLLGGPDL